ncbi:MAG: DUF3857 domain-containing protein [Flavobacterium sp.]|nr:DUF3857 domain-containing protein [Flavobacterium sp.]
MKTRIATVITLLMVTILTVNAQKFELGKVTIEELQEKNHPREVSAPAAVLFERGSTYFTFSESSGSFQITTEIEVRIKIYTKEGYEWSNKTIQYYTGDNPGERVDISKAYTYNLVNGKIEKTKLKSDGEFTEKINKFWSTKKITMPNVKEGSVIEYKYTIDSPYTSTLPQWTFQSSIPVNYSEYKTAIPEYYSYNAAFKGFIAPVMTKESKSRSLNITSKERNGDYVTKTTYTTDRIDYSESSVTYVEKDLPAMKDEDFVNNINNYTSSVSHELSMVKWPNSPIKTFSTDWESVAKTIYDRDDFGVELNKTGYFEDDIKALTAGLTNDAEKTAAIFNYVKSNIKWDEYYGYSCNEGVRRAYKDRIGNVAEINLMLTAMLRYVDITANPVLVSTRSNGIPLFPSRSAFNYVIAAVELPGHVLLLDATEKYAMPGILPVRDLNWFGRLIRKDGTSAQIDLIPNNVSKEVVNLMFSVNSNGEINGKMRTQFSDQKALAYRQRNVGLNKDAYLEKLENENNKIEISEYARENELDLGKPVVESFSFKETKGTDVIGDKIYFSPLLFLAEIENPFKQEKREYPVDFAYPTEYKYNINIEIPDGYVLESMPQPSSISTENKMGVFKFSIANTGNKIQVIVVSDMNEAIVPAENYQMLKDFYQKMIEKQTEKIVLKKV